MGDPGSAAITAAIWLLKFMFYSGWYVTKWMTWLTWPIWTSAFGLGALWGLG
jgi:hypothetical protein